MSESATHPRLDFKSILVLIEEGAITQMWSSLISILFTTFSNIEALLICFDNDLSFRSLDHFYSTVIERCPISVHASIVNGMICLLDKFRLNSSDIEVPAHLLFVPIILSNTRFLCGQNHPSDDAVNDPQKLMWKVCEVVAQLENEMALSMRELLKCFVTNSADQWKKSQPLFSLSVVTTMPISSSLAPSNDVQDPTADSTLLTTVNSMQQDNALSIVDSESTQTVTHVHQPPTKSPNEAEEIMRQLVTLVQHFITLRVEMVVMDQLTEPSQDDAVNFGTVLLGYLCLSEAKEQLTLKDDVNDQLDMLIPLSEFYNEAVNEHISVKKDFPHWKARNGFDIACIES